MDSMYHWTRCRWCRRRQIKFWMRSPEIVTMCLCLRNHVTLAPVCNEIKPLLFSLLKPEPWDDEYDSPSETESEERQRQYDAEDYEDQMAMENYTLPQSECLEYYGGERYQQVKKRFENEAGALFPTSGWVDVLERWEETELLQVLMQHGCYGELEMAQYLRLAAHEGEQPVAEQPPGENPPHGCSSSSDREVEGSAPTG